MAKSPGTLDEIERQAIARAVESAGSRKDAAKNLGIALSTLYEKMKKYGM
jgi:transcriptional regulator with PAS, ATPase and Fis domain